MLKTNENDGTARTDWERGRNVEISPCGFGNHPIDLRGLWPPEGSKKMSVETSGAYSREKLALYLAGLLPDDLDEAKKVLKLTKRLLPTLQHSRDHREAKA
jgi:hypothetical protein